MLCTVEVRTLYTFVHAYEAIHTSCERIASQLWLDQASLYSIITQGTYYYMISLFYPWDTISHSDYHGSNELKNYTGQELLHYLS